MTKSDRELKADLAWQKKRLFQCVPSGWTAEKIQEQIAYIESQLSKPRSERTKFTLGSI